MKQKALFFLLGRNPRGWLHALLLILLACTVMASASAQVNNAQYITQAVPSTMIAGRSYEVSVTMLNTGSNSWDAGANYSLGAQNPQDNSLWGGARVPSAKATLPWLQQTFRFTVTAPAVPGIYNFQWQMVRGTTEWFGATTPNVAVSVVPAPPVDSAAVAAQLMAIMQLIMDDDAPVDTSPTISVIRTPNPMVVGKPYALTWHSTNATSVSMNCTSTGTGYAGSVNRALSGTVNETASASWVGNPSTCTWTASGAKGSKSVTETMSTVTRAVAGLVTYYHNDLSGSPMAATDEDGNMLWKETYEPYGDKIHRQAASATNKIGFHGRPYDDNTGLSFMGARYYDPVIGRFLGIDPKAVNPEDVHSVNRYAYANNNPYRYVDPDGHSPIDVAFLVYDIGKLGYAMYKGQGVSEAATDVAFSVVGLASPVPGSGQAIKAARAARVTAKASTAAREAKVATQTAAKALPDSALVCRGGTCKAEQFANGSGVTMDAAGKMDGVSVNSAPGKTLEELTAKIPNKQVGVTTVGDVRKAGGDVIPSATTKNPDHCTLCGITPEKAEQLMNPTQRNPNVR